MDHITWIIEFLSICILIYFIYIGISVNEQVITILAAMQFIPFVILGVFINARAPENTFITDDLNFVYFIWLLTTFSPFYIAISKTDVFRRPQPALLKSTIRALWLDLSGGFLLVLGIFILYIFTGTVSSSDAAVCTSREGPSPENLNPGVLTGIGLIFFAGLGRILQLPFLSRLLFGSRAYKSILLKYLKYLKYPVPVTKRPPTPGNHRAPDDNCLVGHPVYRMPAAHTIVSYLGIIWGLYIIMRIFALTLAMLH